MGFLDLNIAVSGLFASQRGLHVTNHNIANANTEGYSRQKVDQEACYPMALMNGKGMLGMGVDSKAINQVRNSYFDYKLWNENKGSGEWSVKRNQFAELEAIFNEPSQTGIRQVIDDFFASLQELSKNPADISFRSAVMEKARAFTQTLNNMAEGFIEAQKEADFAVRTKVDEVNAITDQIVELNKQIFRMEIDKTPANDLRDQRSLLVDKLSKIVNIQVAESGEPGNQHFKITMHGMILVDHYTRHELALEKKDGNNPLCNMPDEETQDGNTKNFSMTGLDDVYQVVWKESGNPVIIDSGELKGYLDVRDGQGEKSNGNSYRGIPYYLTRLNKFTQEFAEKFNEVHEAGFDLDGNNGGEFFTFKSGTAINARTITLSDAIQDDLNKIAAASEKDGKENNKNINALLDLRHSKDIFSTPVGTPDDFIKSILASLAVDSQQAVRMDANQAVMVEQIQRQRMSISGVSLDEEMGNIIKYQHVYNAAARMVTTMDEIYETMINRLGLVGR